MIRTAPEREWRQAERDAWYEYEWRERQSRKPKRRKQAA